MEVRKQKMNEKFFELPEEKQTRIINAGFHVFSENSYKKSPVSEIADAAGISKSLLFFYFRNKKELYLFLWKKTEELVKNALASASFDPDESIFERMYESLKVKASLLAEYPDIFRFSLKVYYEQDPEVKDEIRSVVEPYTAIDTNQAMPSFDPKDFKDGTDLKLMYQDVYLASEGYLWRMSQKKNADLETVLKDLREMTDFWKKTYLK